MSEVSLRRNVVWIVCEDGDRWYRAVCRFVPPLLGSEDRLRISRWGTEPTKAVMARIKTTNGRAILLWELASRGVADLAGQLDSIATIRSEAAGAVQIAWLPPTAAPELCLAAREAGIGIFVDSPACLQRVAEIVTRQLSPLG